MMLDGTHLFPMEKPTATAAAVEARCAPLCLQQGRRPMVRESPGRGK